MEKEREVNGSLIPSTSPRSCRRGISSFSSILSSYLESGYWSKTEKFHASRCAVNRMLLRFCNGWQKKNPSSSPPKKDF